MSAPDWLTARPIAHRGLHKRHEGILENTRSAFLAAVEGGFAIECDVQLSRDGEAVVFHDFTLERLTQIAGRVNEMTAADLKSVPFKETTDRIETLAEMLALVDGRVPVIVEIKSAFDGDLKLTRRAASVISGAKGQIALKSFDSNVVAALRMVAPELPRGIIAQKNYDYAEWSRLTPQLSEQLATLAHLPETAPDFISYNVNDLEQNIDMIREVAAGLPIMTWTVRTPEQRALANAYANQMVFEGFIP